MGASSFDINRHRERVGGVKQQKSREGWVEKDEGKEEKASGQTEVMKTRRVIRDKAE